MASTSIKLPGRTGRIRSLPAPLQVVVISLNFTSPVKKIYRNEKPYTVKNLFFCNDNLNYSEMYVLIHGYITYNIKRVQYTS